MKLTICDQLLDYLRCFLDHFKIPFTLIIALTQTKPISGNPDVNIEGQLALIRQAVAASAGLVVFPELSITGYEPRQASKLAYPQDHEVFNAFQQAADESGTTIITSTPLSKKPGITISLLIFQPQKPMQVYSKQYLHADEEPYFISERTNYLLDLPDQIGLAICYELSLDEHFHTYADQSLDIYLASTAKEASGVRKAQERMSDLARKNQLITLMVNSIGPCDGVVCAGRSAAWDRRGNLIGELPADREGILLVDTLKATTETR